MSSRRSNKVENADATRLRSELEALKKQTAVIEATAAPSDTVAHQFDKLNGTEQAAGSLGVHPEAWNPIK